MNLVQISERLKGLPEPLIRQYANGMNPEIVPPYVALGELQRRELEEKKMMTAQGASQGPQPSVKDQIEQKAGLMALQQMQQQQLAQQQSQPQGPMPAPENVPQPEPQPEAPMMAARGGLARIPVRRDMFEYAGGGIVAFANGGDTMGTPSFEQQELASQAASITDEMVAERRNKAKMISDLEQKLAFLTNAGAPQAAEVRAQLDALKESEAPKRAPSAPPAARQAPPPQAGAKMDSGLLAAAKAKPAPAAPRPAPAAPRPAPAAQTSTGLNAALPARSPYFAQVNADLAKEIPAPTPQGIIAEQRALSPEVMQEEFMKKRMEEQRQRAAGERAAFEKSRPSGLDDLIRVFGQSSQYKGLSGVAPAYTANQQQKRAEELAMEKRQNELLTGVDAREYEGGEKLFSARTSAMKDANASFQSRLKARSEVLAQMAGVDQRAIDSALDRQTQVQIQAMRDAASKLDRSSPGKGEKMLAEVLALRAAGKNKEADMIIETINALEGRGGREDTFTKKMEAERVRIAGSMMTPDMKKKALDDLDALEKRGSGGGSSGVIDKNNPLLK
jgi:hypothetical protein